MSFSMQVKQELFGKVNGAEHCDAAELAAVIDYGADLINAPGGTIIAVRLENRYVCAKFTALIKKLLRLSDAESAALYGDRRIIKDGRSYGIYLDDYDMAARVLTAAGMRARTGRAFIKEGASPRVVPGACCRRAYVRGAFLAAGVLSDPEKTYHAEFAGESDAVAKALKHILNTFSLNAKLTSRKQNAVVYLKESGRITDLLNVMEAHQSLMELANVRIVKDVRNRLNRKVNFEAANLNKTVAASVKQLDDVNFIIHTKGISYLNEQLAEAAALRLKYQDMSLKELGGMFNKPVSKSGVNHRFRKIGEIAEDIRESEGE